MKRVLLEVKNLKKYFPVKKDTYLEKQRYLKAVDGISFTIHEGETLGLVGESGCGKSTTGKMLVKLLNPTAGTVSYEGKNIFSLSVQESKNLKRQVQMIFQDPYSSLDPRQRAGKIIMEPLVVHGQKEGAKERVLSLMDDVGLLREYFDRYPHEFSGGQRQRIGVARALALNPSLIICDEPVSALDVSIQAQIVNLMQDLQDKYHLTYLFISHDLRIVKHICDRIAVMYLGRIVELADKQAIFDSPLHPYTQALLSSIPDSDPEHPRESEPIKGDVASPIDPPSGCHFHPRCPKCLDICTKKAPMMVEPVQGHFVECHLFADAPAREIKE
ncbi:MAG: peptide/nickel transport system ATP-binding protein [Spirochaetes bacterium]|nr:MAG: peptide/nickel transport system ATP-binding protein [Spirochaetota bacterium]